MKFKTTQFLVLMIIVNLCAGIGYYFFFSFIQNQIESNLVLADKIDLTNQQNNKLSDLQATVKDTEAERQQLLSFLLPTGSEVSFIEQIEGLAKASGLDGKTNNVAETPNQIAGVKQLDIQLTETGSWNNAMYFLGQLENLPYNLDIRGISLIEQPSGVKNKAGLWTGSFDFSVTENL